MGASSDEDRRRRARRGEAELVTKTRKLLPPVLSAASDRVAIKGEVGVGRCIADLVALLVPEDAPVRLAAALSVFESVILATLRRAGTMRIDALERRCGYERLDLRSGSLDRLVERELIERRSGGHIALRRGSSSTERLIAFEAKLTKWRSALRQAEQYLRYADEAYVVLPVENSEPALKKRTEFETAGIGLFVLDGADLALMIPARRASDHDWRREFVLSRLSDVGKA